MLAAPIVVDLAGAAVDWFSDVLTGDPHDPYDDDLPQIVLRRTDTPGVVEVVPPSSTTSTTTPGTPSPTTVPQQSPPTEEKNVNNAQDQDSPGGDSSGGEADDDSTADNTADENSAGNYCGPWTAFAYGVRPDRGGVTLFVNGAAYSQVQSSYANREWATARCQAVLASLGQ